MTGFDLTQFLPPSVHCAWAGMGQPQTLVTPVIADLDGDGRREIVFQQSMPDALIALHADDCTVLFYRPFDFGWIDGQETLAVADLDGDGRSEIIGIRDRFVVVFDDRGILTATSPLAYDVFPDLVVRKLGTVAVANVDGQGPPEIVIAGQVLRYTTVGGPKLTVLWTQKPVAPEFGPISLAADLDGDGKLEVVVGTTVYDGVTGADKTPSMLAALAGGGAYPAIGDFNGDGKPDLVLVQYPHDSKNFLIGREQVSVFDYSGNRFLFGPVLMPTQGFGPPTVADFDGDGAPEFATAGIDHFTVFDLECAVPNPPPKCDPQSNIGILWQKPTQDKSSFCTSSSAFDLNGDGIPEAIYRDECWLRVYNGSDGRTLFAQSATSGTGLEMPTVADVDGDGHAEIIFSSDSATSINCAKTPEVDTGAPWTGPTQGITVLQDMFKRWMPARPVWNQHAYHSTNIGDDLKVPAVEKPSWIVSNSYRAQPSLAKREKVPDYTAAEAGSVDATSPDCTKSWSLRAAICNRGAVAADAGVPGTFYLGPPQTGSPAICTAKTTLPLPPGQCEVVSCSWSTPPVGEADLWFVANDDGHRSTPLLECRPTNDSLHLPHAMCVPLG